jgi:hypothetical protein
MQAPSSQSPTLQITPLSFGVSAHIPVVISQALLRHSPEAWHMISVPT